MTGISLQRDLGLALLPTGPALAHEKPLADPAVNIQTAFNAFNIHSPSTRSASPGARRVRCTWFMYSQREG